MQATIKQIAEMAGVCRATVDKVLHDRPGVSGEVRARVQRVIDDLGYRPNAAGRALRLHGTPRALVAVLLEVDSLPALRGALLRAAAPFADFGLTLTVRTAPYPDAGAQARLLNALDPAQTAGVIVAALPDACVSQAIRRLCGADVPVVTINTDAPDSGRACFVGQPFARAGETAARLTGFLLGGRGRVALIGGSPRYQADRARTAGFRARLSESYPDIEICAQAETGEDPLTAYRETLRLLQAGTCPDALFVTGGCVPAVGRAVRSCKAPGALRIVCFDAFPETRALVREGYIDCVIDQDFETQGRLPVQLLFDLLFYGKPLPEGPVYTQVRILVRENLPEE